MRLRYLLCAVVMLSYSFGIQAQEQTPSGPSKKKAIILSLLAPGTGELYLSDWKFERWGSGKYFATTEVLFWATHFYTRAYSGWLKEDARALAARKAGVDIRSPKPAKYYVNIGKYRDIYTYNETQRRATGTEFLYDETDANYWQWQKDSDRRKYDKMRADTKRFRQVSTYMYFGLFVNHVMSIVHVTRQYKRMTTAQSTTGWRFYIEPPSTGTARIQLVKTF